MDFTKLADIRLREGAGGGADGFCVMELVSWISGDTRATDEPACACPYLTAFAIALNDSAINAHVRDEMKPLAFLLVNSRDLLREQKRGHYLLRACAQRILAPLLSAAGLEAEAYALREASTPRRMRRAARAAEAAFANVSMSESSANARAAAARLGEAWRGDRASALRALRDCLYCALSAVDDPETQLSLWRDARDILCAAIAMGKHSARQLTREAARKHTLSPA